MQNNYKNAMKKWFSVHFFRISWLFVSLDCPVTGYYHPTLQQEKYIISYEIPCLPYQFFHYNYFKQSKHGNKTNDPLHANQIILDATD